MTDDKTDNTLLNLSEYGLVPPQMEGSPRSIPLQIECVYIPIIGHIDITNNTFEVKVDIDLTWEATNEDMINYHADPSKYTPTFVPDLVFVNSMSFVDNSLVPLKGEVLYQIRGEEDKRNYIRHRFIGTMANNFEIESFPFDIHNLPLVVSISFYTADQTCFKIRSDGEPFIYVPRKYTAVPGFELSRTFGDAITDPSNFSVLIVAVQVTRIKRPFFFRIFMPLLSLNAATFSIHAFSETEEKIDVLITILLSFIGMIYVLSTLVPIAGKSNIFDRYAMFSIMLCVFMIILVTFDGENLQIHLYISILLHLYVLVSMLIKGFEARAKMNCGVASITKNLELEDLTYSKKLKEA